MARTKYPARRSKYSSDSLSSTRSPSPLSPPFPLTKNSVSEASNAPENQSQTKSIHTISITQMVMEAIEASSMQASLQLSTPQNQILVGTILISILTIEPTVKPTLKKPPTTQENRSQTVTVLKSSRTAKPSHPPPRNPKLLIIPKSKDQTELPQVLERNPNLFLFLFYFFIFLLRFSNMAEHDFHGLSIFCVKAFQSCLNYKIPLVLYRLYI
jgi:hypothetical protein